ncbi:Asp23/Gls24 family envelope stress response protein [Saccharothrix sp. AJ9571]|nr:Asp23/Gls24 family envelope stress response protein [Saccharothrix sp. AJ9571]
MAQTSATNPNTGTTPALSTGSTPVLNEDGAQGKTTIASAVVQKVAGIAAREVSGVYALGGGVSRAFGAIKERIPGSGTVTTAGVSVEVGEKQTAVDLDVVVEYGARIVDVARAVRRNVISTVEQITGLEVIEVNIAVNDIHLPEDDEAEESNARVE